jgi:predicted RNA-binding Zn-ribbon protein involved in translation (DUF1610 family)
VGGSRRNLILGGVAVVILGVAAVLYVTRAGSGKAELPTQALTYGVCLACQQDVEVAHGMTEQAPFVCPKCGARAVYPWFYCLECKKRVVPHLEKVAGADYPVLPVVPVCPACGASRLRAYRPDIGIETSGDAPLPPWPP